MMRSISILDKSADIPFPPPPSHNFFPHTTSEDFHLSPIPMVPLLLVPLPSTFSFFFDISLPSYISFHLSRRFYSPFFFPQNMNDKYPAKEPLRILFFSKQSPLIYEPGCSSSLIPSPPRFSPPYRLSLFIGRVFPSILLLL